MSIFNNFWPIFTLLEVWFYMNGPSKLAALISCKQFFGFELTKCTFVCSYNQIEANIPDLNTKIIIEAKKVFAINWCSQLRRTVHIKPDL